MWGSCASDQVGEQILPSMDELNSVLLNDGSPTRLTKPNGGVPYGVHTLKKLLRNVIRASIT